jgi:protease-4
VRRRRGKYAQLLAENKAFTAEEEALFDAAAQHAYESFRDKAAASRGMSVEAMQEVAQGRVWSGRRAAQLGLVDAVGGVSRAVQLAKQAAGLKLDEGVRLLEVSRAKVCLVGGLQCARVRACLYLCVCGEGGKRPRVLHGRREGEAARGGCAGRRLAAAGWRLATFLWPPPTASPSPPPPLPPLQVSPLQLLSSGGASLPAALGMLLLQTVFSGGSAAQAAAAARVAAGTPVLLEALAAAAAGSAAGSAGLPAAGAVRAEMPGVSVEGVSSLALLSQGGDSAPSPLFDV